MVQASLQIITWASQVQMYHVSSAVSKSYDAWLELPQRQKLVIYNSTDYELMVKSSSESEFNLEKKGD